MTDEDLPEIVEPAPELLERCARAAYAADADGSLWAEQPEGIRKAYRAIASAVLAEAAKETDRG